MGHQATFFVSAAFAIEFALQQKPASNFDEVIRKLMNVARGE
jgi:hypothetical protein